VAISNSFGMGALTLPKPRLRRGERHPKHFCAVVGWHAFPAAGGISMPCHLFGMLTLRESMPPLTASNKNKAVRRGRPAAGIIRILFSGYGTR
jgi:hypothetical protein